jgi:hypothetical protein
MPGGHWNIRDCQQDFWPSQVATPGILALAIEKYACTMGVPPEP